MSVSKKTTELVLLACLNYPLTSRLNAELRTPTEPMKLYGLATRSATLSLSGFARARH